MLTLYVGGIESYDNVKGEFYNTPRVKLTFEHSLVAISKWESKWNKPFIGCKTMTKEEEIDYICCMLLDDYEEPMEVINQLTIDQLKQILEYIALPMTATTVNNNQAKKPNREIVTSEVIYYRMIAFNIPFECQYWHLNRLLMLITVCDAKNSPPKKMSSKNVMAQNKALNAARKKALATSG